MPYLGNRVSTLWTTIKLKRETSLPDSYENILKVRLHLRKVGIDLTTLEYPSEEQRQVKLNCTRGQGEWLHLLIRTKTNDNLEILCNRMKIIEYVPKEGQQLGIGVKTVLFHSEKLPTITSLYHVMYSPPGISVKIIHFILDDHFRLTLTCCTVLQGNLQR
jgi:hypothetical protein